MKTILIAAGGTGGHIFPALAIADKLRGDYQIIWLGSKHGMENYIVTKHDYKIFTINAVGLRGKSFTKLLLAPFKLLLATIQTINIIYSNKVDLVIAMGGYVGGIGGFCAWLCRSYLFIHEQNSIPGSSNKILHKLAHRSFQGFDGTLVGAITCGNPILWHSLPNSVINKKINLLVLGGSLGASVINEIIIKLNLNINIYHQTGKKDFNNIKNLNNHTKVVDFITDMPVAYSWADVVLCRSGAMTIAELIATKSIAILVPFPYAIDDHQTINAKILSDNGCAILLPQTQLNIDNLTAILKSFTADKIKNMRSNYNKFYPYDGAEIIKSYVIKDLTKN